MTDQTTTIRKVPQVQAMLDPTELTEARTRDLTVGSNAVVAFWEAAVADARFSQPHESPMRRCILAALSVRDILHRSGRTDAAVAKYGLLLRRFSSDPMREVVTGDRTAPVLANAWNAHMVVRVGDVVLDPTFGQFKRDWNRAPDTFACLTSSPEDCKRASVRLGREVKAYRYFKVDADWYEAAYFTLARAEDLRTRRWHDSPDASDERRAGLVNAAVDVLRQRELAD